MEVAEARAEALAQRGKSCATLAQGERALVRFGCAVQAGDEVLLREAPALFGHGPRFVP